MIPYFFLSGSRKKKDNKKERLPSALFELLRHFSTLNKKNSLRSNSFLFLTLRKAPPLYVQKVRPDIRRNIASLVEVDVFMYFTFIVHSEQKEGFEQSHLINTSPQNRTKKQKPTTSEAMFIPLLPTNLARSGI